MRSRVDFSRGASAYDRRHGALLPDDLARQIAKTAGLAAAAPVLDVGAGTGRVAIPLAALGYQIVAVDPSAGMLSQLRSKSDAVRPAVIAAEGGRLPLADASFDAVVFARVLYIIPDWREAVREAARVVRPAGAIVHEWGNGTADEEWVQIREEARRLFEAAGVQHPFHPGVRSEADVEAAFASYGFIRQGEIAEAGHASMTLAEFLRRIVDGECSYTWNVPAAVQAKCLPKLTAWAAARFDLDAPRLIPRDSRWKIYRR